MKIKSHNSIAQPQNNDQQTLKYSKIVTRNHNKLQPQKQNIKNNQKIKNVTYATLKSSDEKQNRGNNKNAQINCNRAQILPKHSIPDVIDSKDQQSMGPKYPVFQIEYRKASERDDRHVAEYQKAIVKYIKSIQSKFKIGSNYLRNLDHITHQHRATFVKHFFKIGRKFQLKRTTIYLAVYYMDAYFEKNPRIQKRPAIIAAQACLFIATKYQQIYPPELYEWSQLNKQIFISQSQILKCLDFNLAYHSLQHYLQLYFSKINLPQNQKQMIRLIADVSLFDQSLYGYGRADLSLAMIYSIINRNQLQEKMEMSIKWMLQRNQAYMQWLQTIHNSKTKSNI